LPLISNYIVLV